MAVIARDQITLTDMTDVKLARPYYILVSNTAAAPSKPTSFPPPTGWVTSEPAYDSSKTAYMSWYIEYSNGLFEYSDVSKVSSYEAAKEAWNKANNAESLASDVQKASNWYAECETASATAAKEATITPATSNFELQPGATVYVYIDNTNTAAVANLTLNVNSTGAKNIKYIYNNTISNLPGTNYLVGGATYQFFYDGAYWICANMNYNTNTNTSYYLQYYNYIKMLEAYTKNTYKIICGTSAGYKYIGADVSFDLAYPLLALYQSSAISVNGTTTSAYLNFYSVALASGVYGSAIPGFAVNKKVYLKGTIVANTFTIASTEWITATEPSSEDSYYYIPLGSFANNATASNGIIYFISSSTLYKFYDGSFQPISSSSVVTSKTLTDSINDLSNSFTEDLTEQRNEFNEVLTGYATNESVANQIKTVSDELENWKKKYGEDQIEYSASFQKTDEDISIITDATNRATLQEILTKFQFKGSVLYIITDDNGIHSEQGSDFYQYVKGGSIILKIDPNGIKATEASISGAINIGSGDVSAFSDQWAIRKGAKNSSGQYDLDFVWVGG